MCAPVIGLQSLPVELLYELQLYALSHILPYISRRIHEIFKSAPPYFRAQYILGRLRSSASIEASEIYTRALRYPICTQDVVEAISRQLPDISYVQKSELPRRLFRPLSPKVGELKWKESDPPLPFLQYLFKSPKVPPLDVNSYEGYALTKAVHAKFVPLVKFLLHHDASPRCKNGLSVLVAIRQKDLGLVKLLIERDSRGESQEGRKNTAKRRRLEDRVTVNRDMLKTAVRCDARDIVEYLTREKGIVPDMQTLHMMK